MTLTQRQQARVAKALPAQKSALRAQYNRQNNSPNQLKPKSKMQRPQPKRAPARRGVAKIPRSLEFAFDAFDKRHMPLDELTAPYTTTNFISVMEFSTSISMDQIVVVCPRTLTRQETYTGPLTDFIAMRYDANEYISSNMATLETMRSPIIDSPAQANINTYSSVRARLHNMSVKLECLGTNTGLYPPGAAYIGTVPCIETGSYSTGSEENLKVKTAWADDSIMVGYLRSISAASLINKPCILHSAVAENTSYKSWNDLVVPSTGEALGSLPFSTALEPIVIYVPKVGSGDTAVTYRVVVGQQWCSRHPHNVMLRSTQKQHSATAPNDWHKALSAVKDIGEHILKSAGKSAVDVLTERMQSAYMRPGNALANVSWVD